MFAITIGFTHVVVHVIGNPMYTHRSTSCVQKGALCVSLDASLFERDNFHGDSRTIDLVSVNGRNAHHHYTDIPSTIPS